MQCKSRITKENTKQLFGDALHYFYLEMRCTGKGIGGYEVCAACIEKNPACITQASKKFDHGLINMPITEKSHIYGSPWYLSKLDLYGKPTPETEEFALQYQNEARGDFVVSIENIIHKADKHKKGSMPRSKQSEKRSEKQSEKPEKPEKPEKSDNTQPSAIEEIELHPLQPEEPATKPKRSRKKPQISNAECPVNPAESLKKQPAKKSTRKRPQIAPDLISTIEQEHKDSCIATHIENDIEELDLGDCDIVYVDLVEFEHDNIKYYHEPRKGKLYKKLKDKSIGQYVGRFNAEKSTIDTTIPDSDDEGDD